VDELGASGAASGAAASAGAATSAPQPQGAAASQPQLGAAAQPQLGAASQHVVALQHFLQARLAWRMSRREGQLTSWVSQPQAGATCAQPQGAAAGSAQPQAGAASQPQAGSAQPQVGAGSQQAGAQHLALRQRCGLQHLLRNRPASLLAAIATTTTIKAVNTTIIRFIVLIPPLGKFWASPGITLPSPMRQYLLVLAVTKS
jgi:hypothetical protein